MWGMQWDVSSQTEQFAPILTGIGGHTTQSSLVEQGLFVVEGWNLGHIHAGQRQVASSVKRCESEWNKCSRWGKDNTGSRGCRVLSHDVYS